MGEVMKSPSIVKYLVQDRMTSEDNEILHRKGFNVNMRLFKESAGYRKIILDIIMYMGRISKKEFSDYPQVRGISGANIGIPLNIIGMRSSRNISDNTLSVQKDDMYFMINPEIVERGVNSKVVKSNCGSIRLPEKINVKRSLRIKVKYFDIGGAPRCHVFHAPESFTVQHEIDHNSGILVTDIEYKENQSKEAKT
jgi:peptide deformylase